MGKLVVAYWWPAVYSAEPLQTKMYCFSLPFPARSRNRVVLMTNTQRNDSILCTSLKNGNILKQCSKEYGYLIQCSKEWHYLIRCLNNWHFPIQLLRRIVLSYTMLKRMTLPSRMLKYEFTVNNGGPHCSGPWSKYRITLNWECLLFLQGVQWVSMQNLEQLLHTAFLHPPRYPCQITIKMCQKQY